MKVTDTLVLEDRMSQTIKAVQVALEHATASTKIAQTEMEMIKKAYGDTSIEAAKATLAWNKQAQEVEKLENKLKDLEQQQKNTTNKMVGLIAAYQTFQMVSGFIRNVVSNMDKYIQAAQLQSQSEGQLSVITKQRMGLNDAEVKSLYALAAAQQKVGIVGDEEVMAGMAGIAMFTKQKSSIEALTPAMNNLAVKMAGYNVNAGTMEQVSRVLGKAMAGQVDGLSRYGIKIDDITKNRLKQLPEEQRAIELARAITNITGDLNEEMAKTPYGRIIQSQKRMGDSMEKMGAILAPIKGMFMYVFANISEIVVNNIQLFLPVILGAIGMIIAGLIAMHGEAIATAISTIVAFWPVVAVCAAIGLALWGITKILDAVGLTWSDVFGMITGVVAAAVGIIQNIFYGLLDFVLGLVNNLANPFIIYANFLKNVFKDPVGAVKNLFFDLGNYIVSTVEPFAGFIDKIFGTSLKSGIEKFKSNIPKSTTEVLKLSTDKMGLNRVNITDRYKAGEQWGKTAADKIKDTMSGFATLGKTGEKNTLEQAMEGGALKTKQQGAIELKEEDLKMLNELATRDFMVRYQALSPSVNFNGDMNISNNVDIMDLVGEFHNGVAEVTHNGLKTGTGE